MKKEKNKLLLIALLLFCNFAWALNITIIESQSNNSLQDMDASWNSAALAMGHTPTISPQTTLDNTAFFSGTDILIVSSGVINLPANRINTILQFMQSGKPVYLQSEYLQSCPGNQAFSTIINSLGGTFSWNNQFTGNLGPVTVLGSFASVNNDVDTMSYYWFSVSGSGDCNTINFLKAGGTYHGFQYIPTNTSYGSIVTTTDQDWIRYDSTPQLMENIITNLISPDVTQLLFPQVNIGNDTTLCYGQSIALSADTAVSYLWSNDSTTSSINVSLAGTYWVTVSNGQCAATDSLSVFVFDCEEEIELPDIFTPNGDSLNDVWFPVKYKRIANASLKIYNRWGNELFYTEDLIKGWNGLFKENVCADGTYYWIVQYATISGK
ncbi:MAG: gliding motility-associated C-terminal domain-containing protein, partial [Bacteroidia bacterium]|nr:gliding motility-associated C-terminal domain-containing protein [Bacteroidia bacterium]